MPSLHGVGVPSAKGKGSNMDIKNSHHDLVCYGPGKPMVGASMYHPRRPTIAPLGRVGSPCARKAAPVAAAKPTLTATAPFDDLMGHRVIPLQLEKHPKNPLRAPDSTGEQPGYHPECLARIRRTVLPFLYYCHAWSTA